MSWIFPCDLKYSSRGSWVFDIFCNEFTYTNLWKTFNHIKSNFHLNQCLNCCQPFCALCLPRSQLRLGHHRKHISKCNIKNYFTPWTFELEAFNWYAKVNLKLRLRIINNFCNPRSRKSSLKNEYSTLCPSLVALFEWWGRKNFILSFVTNIAIFRQIDMEFWITKQLRCKFWMSVHPFYMVS